MEKAALKYLYRAGPRGSASLTPRPEENSISTWDTAEKAFENSNAGEAFKLDPSRLANLEAIPYLGDDPKLQGHWEICAADRSQLAGWQQSQPRTPGLCEYPPPGTAKAEWPGIVGTLIANDGGAGSPDVINALLCWLKDANWPGAGEAWRYLLTLGEKVVPHAVEILKTQDAVWRYWIIESLASEWPDEYVLGFAYGLKFLAVQDDREQLNISAARLLIKRHMVTHDEAHEMLSKIQGLRPDLASKVDEIRAMIPPRE